MTGIIATAEIQIDASPTRVWAALTDPAQVKAYMFGTDLATDWTVGSRIVWSGEYEGRPYEDKGQVVEVDPPHRLTVTHYSPLSGQPDVPESYHTLTYRLDEVDRRTRIRLSQDNNPTEEAAEHSRRNWAMMLDGLKKYVEGAGR
jgi:uncharacterized protein YndB with AHSA1/START domain